VNDAFISTDLGVIFRGQALKNGENAGIEISRAFAESQCFVKAWKNLHQKPKSKFIFPFSGFKDFVKPTLVGLRIAQEVTRRFITGPIVILSGVRRGLR
jgi:hypothetical protein